jgi:hypothetical protein
VDGELLGTSTAQSPNVKDPEAFGALVADIANGYGRLGEEYAAVDAVQRSRSNMQFLLVEMGAGLVGVSSCVGCDCYTIAVAAADAPPGLVKARLHTLSMHVQDAFSAVS